MYINEIIRISESKQFYLFGVNYKEQWTIWFGNGFKKK